MSLHLRRDGSSCGRALVWAVRAAVLAEIVACAREGPASTRSVQATAASPSFAEQYKVGWTLQEASELLQLLVINDGRVVGGGPLAQSVPLSNGGILAAVEDKRPWEHWTCFLELQLCDDGWRPKGVGLFLSSDYGFYWKDVEGRVLVNAERDDVLHCRVDLQEPTRAFQCDFRVQPDADSAVLRDKLAWWGAVGPTLRGGR